MDKPVVVLSMSGGMDSCVSAAILAERYELAFFHLSYGQRTEKRERQAVRQIARFYGTRKNLLATTDLYRKIGSSSLTDSGIDLPAGTLERMEVPSTYVPFRNGLITAAAVSWAESIRAPYVAIGAVEEDSSGYPDCRGIFFSRIQKAVDAGIAWKSKITILTPVIDMKKYRIVQEGMRLGAPFHLTWSCYRNTGTPCGRCDSCLLRGEAFERAGVTDPLLNP
jgi:7-cyano-7-deazaguanine synthase